MKAWNGRRIVLLSIAIATIAGSSTRAATPVSGAIARPVVRDSSGRLVPQAPRRVVEPLPARSDTAWDESLRPHPTARYGSFRVARDSLRAIVRRALGAWADSARWVQDREPFVYRDSPKAWKTNLGTYFWVLEDRDTTVTVPCLHMEIVTHSNHAHGADEIAHALTAAGWAEDTVYGSDGADGTHFLMVCREAMCDVGARWDGGDESDSTYVPAPGQEIELRCVPRPTPRDPRAHHP